MSPTVTFIWGVATGIALQIAVTNLILWRIRRRLRKIRETLQ